MDEIIDDRILEVLEITQDQQLLIYDAQHQFARDGDGDNETGESDSDGDSDDTHEHQSQPLVTYDVSSTADNNSTEINVMDSLREHMELNNVSAIVRLTTTAVTDPTPAIPAPTIVGRDVIDDAVMHNSHEIRQLSTARTQEDEENKNDEHSNDDSSSSNHQKWKKSSTARELLKISVVVFWNASFGRNTFKSKPSQVADKYRKLLKQADSQGRLIVMDMDEYNTSKMCSGCGSKNLGGLELNELTASLYWQRDVNAARNIRSLFINMVQFGARPGKLARPTPHSRVPILVSSWRMLSTLQQEARSRRALFYVPGSDERKIHKSISIGADCVVYDLEDSVSANKKGIARQQTIDALEASEHGKAEKAVRINAIGSDDLNVILHSKRLQAIVIPKVQSAKDIQFVSRMIDAVAVDSQKQRIRLIASVESALALMNIKEIATADERLDALIFAAEDYCADLGLIRTPSRKEMLYARQTIVNAAGAYGLQAIDLVCVDYQNEQVLLDECKEGREFGFSGKQAIHPAQIDIIQKHFLPDEIDINRAAKILEKYQSYSTKGIGAFELDGKMIDMPVVKWADKVIGKAKAGGLTIPSFEEKSQNEKK
ncbi:Pyruvate/Phosphoenolpyruvate kinase-like domain-containing protein [Halteromyces radiatus]|uniref:Pyruvate/Phosphoenolpyruvate kinase-like domain-containing protein n=1 Tax=Halteromyces radiatus TaxID=101107 RepID=UPI0022203B0B|nr:Pyruvate/Phosphoenolpyruvate kinase-like domain-containing protein [Halteromyces radiatus]KAI8099536.1 Pyruvate/Phosphoenolpyruvate kinase-like domain-containing protein [Halteromyces radiatus]